MPVPTNALEETLATEIGNHTVAEYLVAGLGIGIVLWAATTAFRKSYENLVGKKV